MLSEKAQELIKKSRIVSFQFWNQQYSADLIAIFQQADDEGLYLCDQDIVKLKEIAPELATPLEQARLLRDNVKEIVDYARAEVLKAFPQITEPGGGLYPAPRAEACWRDFWHFLRCISYGIAAKSLEYTSQEGLGYMEQLYQELNVPLDAMILGLTKLKERSLAEFCLTKDGQCAVYFDHLISQLEKFAPQPV